MDKVTLVYAPLHQSAVCKHVAWISGMSIQDVIDTSELAVLYPEINTLCVGIFSKQVSRASQVSPGDRVEIYSPLIRDPKEARRKRAKK